MARQLECYTRGLFKFTNALRSPFAKGNRLAEDRAVIEFWELNEPLFEQVDAIKPLGRVGAKSCPLKIRRSLLLKIALASRALGLGPVVGLRRIQTSRTLRAALGLPQATGETIDELRRARGGGEVKERGFPTRQNIDAFVRWMARWGGLEILDDYAHLILPYQIGIEIGGDYSAVTIDSKSAPSPRPYSEQRKDKARTDAAANATETAPSYDEQASSDDSGEDAALTAISEDNDDDDEERAVMGVGREGSKIRPGTPGRLAHGLVAIKNLPVALGGDIVARAENKWAAKTGLPDLARRAATMEQWRKRDRIPRSHFTPADGAAVTGDGYYYKDSKLAKTCNDRGFRPMFRIPQDYRLTVQAEYDAHAVGDQATVVRIEIAGGGLCYCPCDKYADGAIAPLYARTPMTPFIGKRGDSRHVGFMAYRCDHGGIEGQCGILLRVPLDAVRFTDGKPNYSVVATAPRTDKRSEALNFKGQQTIELRNRALAQLGVAMATPSQEFVLTGDLNNRFQLLLTHIVLNSRILLNHRAGLLKLEPYPWLDAFAMAMKKSHRIWKRTARKDADGKLVPFTKWKNLFHLTSEEQRALKGQLRREERAHGFTEPARLRPDLDLIDSLKDVDDVGAVDDEMVDVDGVQPRALAATR